MALSAQGCAGVIVAVALTVGAVLRAQPQAPATGAPSFDVASIKPNRLDDRIVSIGVGPGARFTARGYTLALLIQRAWGVMDWNIIGGPSWIRTDRFDIVAVSSLAEPLSEARLQPMLQGLLADRFSLKLHKETKAMDGYALVVARSGPRMKAAADGAGDPDSFRFTNAGLSGRGISMPDLARFVAGKLGLVATDKTGLKGFYDVDATWTVQPDLSGGLPVDPRDALRTAVFDAMEDALGLKFESSRGPFEVLVIDSAEQPTPD
jgi:uncharacterized protein (TIGR03435 family)